MTKKFCDRCGDETTNNQYQVFNPNVFAPSDERGHAGKQHDVCKGCQEKFHAAFDKIMGKKVC